MKQHTGRMAAIITRAFSSSVRLATVYVAGCRSSDDMRHAQYIQQPECNCCRDDTLTVFCDMGGAAMFGTCMGWSFFSADMYACLGMQDYIQYSTARATRYLRASIGLMGLCMQQERY